MSTSTSTPLIPVLGRLFWLMAGPLGLVLTLYFIVTSGTGWTTLADLIYFLLLGGMVLGRWLEFRGGNPRDSLGEPVTAADLRRYALKVALVGPAVWVAANVLGNHVFAG